VTRTALQNATSIAGLMLTTEAMASEIPEPKSPAPAGGGMAAAWRRHGRHVLRTAKSRSAKKRLAENRLAVSSGLRRETKPVRFWHANEQTSVH